MSRRTALRITVAALVLIAARNSMGQDTAGVAATDLEGWVSAELRYKYNKHWMFSGEEQLRLKDDSSTVDQYFTQLGVRFNAPHGFSLDGGYRWIRHNDTQGQIQGYESWRRHHFSASYKHKVGRFSLGYRLRYQSKSEVGSADSEEADRHFRYRAKVRYNIPDWRLDPVLSAELYQELGGATESDFDKIRLTLGTEWGTWDGGEMGVFWRVERELGVDLPETTYILGLKLTHTLGGN